MTLGEIQAGVEITTLSCQLNNLLRQNTKPLVEPVSDQVFQTKNPRKALCMGGICAISTVLPGPPCQ